MRGSISKVIAEVLLILAFTYSAPLANAADGVSTARPLITQRVDDTKLVQLPDVIRPEMKSAADLGQVPSSMPMPKMQLLLKRSAERQQALETALIAIRTPGSAMYHQPLTTADYSETFGLAASDLDTLQQWLESYGLKVLSVDNGKLAITFKGTAGQVAEAFHTQIHNYRSADLRVHYANATSVQVPAALADVVAGVSGLQNFSILHEANYDGPVIDPQAVRAAAQVKPAEVVGRVAPIAPGTGGEGTFPSTGSIVSYSRSSNSDGTPDAGLATSTTLNLAPNTVTFATPATDVLTATVTWSGGGTPTGALTFYDIEGYLYEEVLISSCALTTNTYTCTYNWTGAGAVTSSPDTLYAVYSGDSTYAESSGTAGLTVLYPHANGGSDLLFSSFSDDPGDQNYGISTPQTLNVTTLEFLVAPTGNILITGNTSIGEIANLTPIDSFCFIICYTSNSAGWEPNALLQPGIYTLTASYSGDGNYADSSTTTTFTVNGLGTTPDTTTVSASPNVVFPATPGTTFTTVTSWSGSAGAPTGQVSLSGPNGTPNGGGLGVAIFPITGALTSTGAGTYDGGAYSYTFNCTTNTVAQNITCTIVDSNVFNPLPNSGPGGNLVTATYGGNSVYEASSGTTIVYKSANQTSGTSVVTSGQAIYGEGTSITYTATVKGDSGLPAPSGTVTFSGTTITGSPLTGTLGNCTSTHNVYSCTASVSASVPYATTPGGYTVTAAYSGSAEYGTSTGTATETVIKQTPTLTAPSLTPNTEPQGNAGPVVMSTTFTWLGSGAAPTGGITFLVGTTTVGTATCTGSGDTLTCTYNYNPSGLAVGNYTVTAHYPGDSNYFAVTSAGTTLSITQATTTPTLTLTSSSYGSTTTGVPSGTTLTLTATLTVPTYNGAWSGTVTFIDATTGVTIGKGNVTATGHNPTTATATITLTPQIATSSSYPAGFNQFTATYNGNTYYSPVGPINASPVYLAGILYSLTLQHNFSVNPGTYDGAQVGGCPGGVTTTACTEPYSIVVYNFTTSVQSTTLTFTNAASGAFGYTTNCTASLAAGAQCAYLFFYEPPQGDGCVLNATSCMQGTYETGSWKVTAPTANVGVGQPGFPTPVRAGATTFPALLAGKALLPAGSMMVSPLSYTFPTIATGVTSNTLTIIVTNPNSSPVPFTYAGPSAPFTATNTCQSPLQGNASCNIYITLESGTAGTFNSSVVITPSHNSAITAAFSGTVQANNGLTLNTDYHNFNNVTLNTSSFFNLSITNNSGATQNVGVSFSSAPAYSVTNGCGPTLAAGAVCSVMVTFTPTTTGTFTDSVTISSGVPIVPGGTGGGSSYSDVVSFTGNGVSGGHFTATSVGHDWGNIDVGTSGGNYGVELSNNTSASITLSAGPLSSTTEGFSLVASNCGTSLAVNASCELIFSFTPNAVGYVSATYPIVSSSPLYSGGVLVSPSQITLSGTGQ